MVVVVIDERILVSPAVNVEAEGRAWTIRSLSFDLDLSFDLSFSFSFDLSFSFSLDLSLAFSSPDENVALTSMRMGCLAVFDMADNGDDDDDDVDDDDDDDDCIDGVDGGVW